MQIVNILRDSTSCWQSLISGLLVCIVPTIRYQLKAAAIEYKQDGTDGTSLFRQALASSNNTVTHTQFFTEWFISNVHSIQAITGSTTTNRCRLRRPGIEKKMTLHSTDRTNYNAQEATSLQYSTIKKIGRHIPNFSRASPTRWVSYMFVLW